MKKLIHDMKDASWPVIVRTFLKHVNDNPDWLDNLVADGRYAWKTLLNLNPQTVFLDIGCGLGNLVHNIAPHVGEVYAMDLTYQRVEFARRRFSIFNREDNISVLAGGDARYLPFPDHGIDCVVLSGVLEWVGDVEGFWRKGGSKALRAMKMALSCFGRNSARTMQRDFLREIKRVLRPNGQLFIAIENRLNYQYFLGLPDHHSRLNYGSLLPRVLANIYSIYANRIPYRTYTYSAYGYRRLLREAGFNHIDIFALSPGYTHLSEIFPVDADVANWGPCTPSSVKEGIKRNKYFVPAYGIVATPSSSHKVSLHDGLLEHIQQTLLEPYRGDPIRIERYIITIKDKGVMTGSIGKQPIVIKLPFTSTGIAQEEQNASILEEIRKAFTSKLSFCPYHMVRGQFNKLSYFVEERVKGRALRDCLQANGRTAYLAQVEEVLEELNPTPTPDDRKLPLVDQFYHVEVVQRLETLFQVIEDHNTQEELRRFFIDKLYGINVATGIKHGDFSVSNIFVQNDRLSGVIDWGTSSARGIPLLDAINYLDSVHRLFHSGDTLSQSVALLASGAWPVVEEQDFLHRQYARFGMDELRHDAFVYLYWLQHVAEGLTNRLIYDAPGIKGDIESIVNHLLGRQQLAAHTHISYRSDLSQVLSE